MVDWREIVKSVGIDKPKKEQWLWSLEQTLNHMKLSMTTIHVGYILGNNLFAKFSFSMFGAEKLWVTVSGMVVLQEHCLICKNKMSLLFSKLANE